MKKTIFLLLAAASACTIKNDIDYPLVPGDITDFVVDHQMSVEINKANRTVHAEVAENADLTQLELLRFSVSDKARCKELKVGDILNLSEPMSVHVRTYQDYVWTIYATVRVSAEIEVNAWAGSAVFTTPADGATADGVYEWRKEGSSEWASSPEITAQAGLYVYEATGLEPGTNYYVRFTLSGTSSGEVAFSTEAEEQVANMGFDEWCSETVYSTKTSWYPAPDATNGGRVWDSANKGVLFIGRDCARLRDHSGSRVRGRVRRRQAGGENGIHVPQFPRHGTFRGRQSADRRIPRHIRLRLQPRRQDVVGNPLHHKAFRAQGLVCVFTPSHRP